MLNNTNAIMSVLAQKLDNTGFIGNIMLLFISQDVDEIGEKDYDGDVESLISG